VKKNRLKFLKNRPVRFQFYKSETEKTEPKPKKTGFCYKITEPKPVGLNWFRFFKKKPVWLFFFIKTEPNRIENNHPYFSG